MEKSLEQRLAECRHVVIQKVDKGMQNTMVFRYMKETKIDNDVKKYILNKKDHFITFEFETAQQARNFYQKANFKDKILIRPFNIYLKLHLSKNEMKKYYLEGLTEDKMRDIFEFARTLGVLKISTSYSTHPIINGLKSNGILSLLREEDVSEKEFAELSEKLKAIGVKIIPYQKEIMCSVIPYLKEIKCFVILTNFYTGNLDAPEEHINNEAQKLAEDFIKKALSDQTSIASVKAWVKRKRAPANYYQEEVKFITKVSAFVEFKSSQDAIENFEEIRIAFLGLGEARAALNFGHAETNSFISLFSTGLIKSNEAWSDKEFEDELIKCYRQVNKDVVQVNVFPAKYNKTYLARIYLKSEKAGKDFIVEYPYEERIFLKELQELGLDQVLKKLGQPNHQQAQKGKTQTTRIRNKKIKQKQAELHELDGETMSQLDKLQHYPAWNENLVQN